MFARECMIGLVSPVVVCNAGLDGEESVSSPVCSLLRGVHPRALFISGIPSASFVGQELSDVEVSELRCCHESRHSTIVLFPCLQDVFLDALNASESDGVE